MLPETSGNSYAFPSVTGIGISSRNRADAFLNEPGVACLAGTMFGVRGEGALRISFTNSIEDIQKALDRIDAWIRENL